MILLVQMPYAAVERPSIALGLIQSELRQAGLACRSYYPNLDWFQALGKTSHQAILNTLSEDLVGEWTFSQAAFGNWQPDLWRYLKRVQPRTLLRPAQLLDIRRRAVSFVDQVAETVLALKPRIVGCSSTFQQHCASLALLRRLKEKDPSILTIMGGANCEGSMGVTLMRYFHWLDYVVSGDADKMIAPFFAALLRGDLTPPHGVYSKEPSSWTGLRSSFSAMDQVAVPDYDDYFRALEASGLDLLPGIPVETSRGCWWGQKHHCTFCGLNGSGMGYRSKSGPRVLSELLGLYSRYQIDRFAVVDNILDHAHLKTIMPELAQHQPPFHLFYETKSNLKREQLQLLAQAGVLWIQPGIESLHDEVLRLMDKGSNGLMNVQLLRNCRELGMVVAWNFLICFPGEKDDYYTQMAEWIPSLVHLQPATGMAPIRFDRFSPYHTNPERYQIEIVPCTAYSQVYPVPEEALKDLAYFFQDPPEQSQREDRYVPSPGRRALYLQLKEWEKQFPQAQLWMEDRQEQLWIQDTRGAAQQSQYCLEGRRRQLLLDSQTPSRLDLSDPEVQFLLQHRLLLNIGERCLSLPTWGPPRELPPDWQGPFGSLERPPEVPPFRLPELPQQEVSWAATGTSGHG